MAVKKVKEDKTIEQKETKAPVGEYFYAVGKRKTSIAQVRIYPAGKNEQGVVVNGKKIENYFPLERLQTTVKSPLVSTGQAENMDVTVKVVGGGITGQAEATRLGIARALVIFNETYRKALRDLGFLTRDARIVERKKPGLKKARRAPQWAKR